MANDPLAGWKPPSAPAANPQPQQTQSPAAPAGPNPFAGYKPPAAPPAPAPAAASAQPPGYLNSTGATGGVPSQPPAADWSIDWSKGGEVQLPQTWRDWGAIANNEQVMGGLPGLRTQAEAARQRLGPIAAGTADAVGSALSPTSLAYAVPGVGPELAGGLHEGLKSAITNWKPDESWGDYGKNVLKDTAAGAAWGGLGHAAAAAAPVVAPPLTRLAVTGGGPVASTGLTHMLFGQGDIARELIGAVGNMGALPTWWDAGRMASAATKNVLSDPAAEQAIKSLFLSGGSALRNNAGPYYNQWIPGQ
jgi:hypothetical protein